MGCPNGIKIHAIGFTYGYNIQPLRGCPKTKQNHEMVQQ
jgi:hypothetical protein